MRFLYVPWFPARPDLWVGPNHDWYLCDWIDVSCAQAISWEELAVWLLFIILALVFILLWYWYTSRVVRLSIEIAWPLPVRGTWNCFILFGCSRMAILDALHSLHIYFGIIPNSSVSFLPISVFHNPEKAFFFEFLAIICFAIVQAMSLLLPLLTNLRWFYSFTSRWTFGLVVIFSCNSVSQHFVWFLVKFAMLSFRQINFLHTGLQFGRET